MSANLEKIIAIVCDCTGISDTHLDEESNLAEDCGMDSMYVSEVALSIEEEFDVVVMDEEMESWRTLGDVCRFLDGIGDQ